MAQAVGWLFDGDIGVPGTILPVSSMRLSPKTHTLHYGDGVFEGIRAYPITSDHSGGTRAVFRLHDHLKRLWFSAELMGLMPLPFSTEEMERACLDVLAANTDDTYLRPVIYRGVGLGVNPLPSKINAFVVTEPWGRYLDSGRHNDGVTVMISDTPRPSPKAMPIILGKCTANYAMNAVLKVQAVQRGFAEAVFLAPDGEHLSEGTGMNLCVVKHGEVITPDASSARLNGITLATVKDLCRECLKFDVTERPLTREDLLGCDEAFFTGTAVEITAITMVDGAEVGDVEHRGSMGPITSTLQKLYHAIVTGEMAFKNDWLTLVAGQETAHASM